MAHDPVREAADRLAGFVVTCRMKNTLDWMECLAVRLNEYSQAIGDCDRVQTDGHGFELVHKSTVRKEEESHE